MASRKGRMTIRAATLPPFQIVPLARWERVREPEPWRYPIAPRYLGTRAWTEIVDGYLNGPESPIVNGWWLLWAERANATYTVAAISSCRVRTYAVLISSRTGVVRRCVRPMAEGTIFREILEGGGDEAWIWRRLWCRLSAIGTAEAAMVTLREQRAPKLAKEAEAWLRRQLEGLGQSPSV